MTVLAAVLVLLSIGDIAITLLLVRVARQEDNPALEERATASVILTFVAALVAILATVYLLDVTLPTLVGTGILSLALLMVSLPQFIWALAYYRGTFR